MNEPVPSLRLASWIQDSLVDGPGLRFTVFAQGCPHRCPGCHNPETQMHRGVTLSGGEPFFQAAAMADFAELVHARGDDVITYTGYVYEKLLLMAESDPDISRLLKASDLLIDGPFILARRSLSLPFRGSSNQRILPLSEAGDALAAEIPQAR